MDKITMDVNVNVPADLLNRLDVIIGQLLRIIETGVTVSNTPEVQQSVNVGPAATPDPEPSPVSDPAPEPVPLSEFQKAVTIKCADPKTDKAAVKALINRYAKSVSGVPADKRQEILDELSRL